MATVLTKKSKKYAPCILETTITDVILSNKIDYENIADIEASVPAVAAGLVGGYIFNEAVNAVRDTVQNYTQATRERQVLQNFIQAAHQASQAAQASKQILQRCGGSGNI